jgi:aminopeptidase N
MHKNHAVFLRFALLLFPLIQSVWSQDSSVLQKVHRDLMATEKKQFINKYVYPHRQLQSNQGEFDITCYRLNLNLNPQNNLLTGEVTIEGKSQSNGLNRLDIDLADNMAVDSISQGGQRLTFSHLQNLLTITLLHSLAGNENFVLTVCYHGNPMSSGLGAFGWDYHGNPSTPIIWSLSEPYGAPSWWSCKDDPADKADSVFIALTVPAGLTAVSNGRLISISDLDPTRTTFYWQTNYPISTYLVSLAVSNYVAIHDWYITSSGDSMPVDYYVYPEHFEAAQEDLNITVDLIAFYASIFGEYPFLHEKYGLAIFPWGGAMEHQTITSYGSFLIRGDHYFDYINAHELAHQWFGDCITIRSWAHIWLNEGFASYAEALWEEHVHGKSAYLNYMKSQERANFSGSLYVTDTTDINALFSTTVYDKGSWVLHMLRGVLGDSLFFTSLKTYATHPDLMYGNALTEDFQSICEQVSGQDLNWFFNQWFYLAGRPEYTVIWYTYGNDPFNVNIKIDQTNSELYQMPLRLQIIGAGIDTTIQIWNNLKSQEFIFRVSNLPESLKVDPENWVLKQLKVSYLGYFEQEIPDVFSVSQNYPNPFNRDTQVSIALPQPGEVTVEIYSVLGQKVYRDQKYYNYGHQAWFWNGKDNQDNILPSGLYFCRIHYKNSIVIRKLTLIK